LGIPVEEKKAEEKKTEAKKEEVLVEAPVVVIAEPISEEPIAQVFGNAKVIRRAEPKAPKEVTSRPVRPSRVAFSKAEHKPKDDQKPVYDRSKF
jgi:hypothetical protein